MPNPTLYGPDGYTPVASAPSRTLSEASLSKRDGDIIKDMSIWLMEHRLEPDRFICKKCYASKPSEESDLVIGLLPTHQLTVQCSCTRWSSEYPVELATPGAIPTDTSIAIVGKKQRPLSTKEAALFTAWKYVMDAHGWAERLRCVDCYANHDVDGGQCRTVVVPNKSITVDCGCTERRWTGVTK